MTTAAIYALVTMVSWGIWALLAQFAMQDLRPVTAMVISYATSVLVALIYFFYQNETLTISANGFALAALAGVFASVGGISLYIGLARGNTTIVTTISALYFMVAALLGVVVLDESLAFTDGLALVLAVVAVILFMYF
jgi:transporter family protein